MDAFDSDVLIFAAQKDDRGAVVAAVLKAGNWPGDCIGSVLLLPELLSHPIQHGNDEEAKAISELLKGIELKVTDEDVAQTSIFLRAKYGLKTVDAIHLATAVEWGADRFHTNNSKDFGPHITEIEVVLA